MQSADTETSVRQIPISQVTVEVHRAVEDSNDLKGPPIDGKKDDVLLVTGGAAACCQVIPQPAGFRAGLDFGEFPPKTLADMVKDQDESPLSSRAQKSVGPFRAHRLGKRPG
jgi:hypothetical protein